MAWPMHRVERSGRTLAYSVAGTGPCLLLPWCNVAWFDFSDLHVLTRTHRVIVASPLGFGQSDRAADGGYSADGLVDDLLHVCDAVGAARFAVVGYSFTGALAAWMACTSDRITSVVAGGFPLLGSYAAVRDDAERLAGDPEFVETVSVGFDPPALLALYRHLATLPDGDLVARRRCPMASFWGGDDDVLHGFDATTNLRAELEAHGVRVDTMPGLSHDGVLLHLDAAFERSAAWLASASARRDGPA